MEKKAAHLYRPEELEAVHVTMEEAETTISISRGENTAIVWTSDNTVLTKLKKVMKAAPKDCVLKEVGWYKGEPVSYKFEVKKKMVRIGAPRVLTDEQREAMSERAKAMQARKNA